MHLHFSCRYAYADGFRVDVTFAATESVVALAGPSGSGKTTILSLVAGLLRPAAGRISFGQAVLVDTARSIWVPADQRGVGLVLQDSLLFPHMTVRRNLTFGARRRGSDQIEFDRMVSVLALGHLLERAPATLSGGEARRVAVGRALLSRPRMLLLDEPWTGLDDHLKSTIVDYLQICLDEWHIPTLLVSHDRDHLDRFANRVVEIRDGRLIT